MFKVRKGKKQRNFILSPQLSFVEQNVQIYDTSKIFKSSAKFRAEILLQILILFLGAIVFLKKFLQIIHKIKQIFAQCKDI